MGNHDGIGAISFCAAGAWKIGDEDPGAAIFSQGGVLARTGPGVFTMTLDQPRDESDFAAAFTWIGTPRPYRWSVDHTSDQVKTIRLLSEDGEDPVDASFSFIFARGPGR